MVQKALEAHSVQVGEEVEHQLAAGDLNGSIEPAVGSRPPHGCYRLDALAWRVMPRPSSVLSPQRDCPCRSSAAAGRRLLVHDAQQLGEVFWNCRCCRSLACGALRCGTLAGTAASPLPSDRAAVRTADTELSLQPLLELAVAAPAVGVAQFLFQLLPDCGG